MILEVDNIELYFDQRRILYGIYLKAETGKITGIIGSNGCGKTCLLQIIFGSLSPKYQNIRIDGRHQKKKLHLTNTIGYLPQHRLLPKKIKIATVFALFRVNWTDFIAIFGSFQKYRNAHADELSFGELRIVETYLIICSKNEIVLLDEPFSFVAPIYVEKFKNLIREKARDSAIIITDHFYRDILDLSDSVYLLKNGISKGIDSEEDLKNEGYINVQ